MRSTIKETKKAGTSRLGLLVAVMLTGMGGWSHLHAQAVDAGIYSGGGFIESVEGGKNKATFGFNLEGLDEVDDGLVDFAQEIDPFGFISFWLVGQGQFQFNDHAANVKFHLDHDASFELNPDGSLPDHVTVRSETVFVPPFSFVTTIFGLDWVGTYRSKEGTGSVRVSVNASDDVFDSEEDKLTVKVLSGPFVGYANSGVVKGGNIEWYPSN